ncbi:DNA polymerase III subunit delta' [Paenibacillus baekrokdamisoli]|uniref:DNA polymerase III subunit delta n=1 Tax=Paenibacillus baekrokdamisoli TaxID=1712516 RepID=A0A3G9JK09_9BACL|nr:DNA polymerase III subunit delta' [Paenibacillus baekrokdamisoli]MBB3072961.1 DNA polymerase-3 subunit delta' [Paenibacillus baekrokdamisoli]BBH23369.1 DNA polymerase III subunit delta' [Paenibacillus baekrokdamisoli]
MSIAQLAGQQKAKRILQHALRSGKVSHAYLFTGPPGSGRMAMANAFAKALFCTAGGEDACGECLECRKFDHGNQPALHVIEPEGASIKIDQIRDLQRELSYKNIQTERKIYIIKRSEAMTLQAANSLLKFLEEPQSQVVAILLTENGQAVLPTIRSRTQWVPFMPLAPHDMLQLLAQEGVPQLIARAAVYLASGLDACRAITQQNGFAEMRNVVIQLGKDSLTRFTAGMISAQQQIFKTELGDQSELMLSLLVLWYKDMIHFQSGRQEAIVFIDQVEWISKHSYGRSADSYVKCMELALEAGKRIRAHVSPQLAVEQMLIRIQEV